MRVMNMHRNFTTFVASSLFLVFLFAEASASSHNQVGVGFLAIITVDATL